MKIPKLIIIVFLKGMNRKAKSTIETFSDSNTCITTLQLQ
jgi:hypothetical protein